MTPEFAAGLRDFLLGAIDSEVIATRRVIENMPAGETDYVPDPKATPALKLAFHIVVSQVWFLDSVGAGEFGAFPYGIPEHVKSPSDVVAWYDEALPPSVARVKALSGEDLTKIVGFFGAFEFPAVVYLNWANIHSIHHRGQLATYLRPMGGKVPSIYGGSADEPMVMPGEVAATA